MKNPTSNLQISSAGGNRRRWRLGVWNLILLVGLLMGSGNFSARAAFVYETPSELVTSGDFDGDGRADALVLDKVTATSALVTKLQWRARLVRAARHGSGWCQRPGRGRFGETNRDAIAVTAVDLNQIRILKLSNPTNSPAPAIVNPAHPGTSLLVGLDAPYGVTADRSWLSAGAHDPSFALIDLFAFIGDSLTSFQDQIVAEGYLSSGNSLMIGTNQTTS